MLEVKNLSYTYKTEIKVQSPSVKNVSFNLREGEALGILGKTGSGKSTLVQMLNGILKPDSGDVFLYGKNIFKDFKSEVYLKIGLVFQYPENQLFENTVFDDIAFGLRNKGCSEKEIKDIIEETIEMLKIDKKLLTRFPLSLSGGEKRRCAIAGIMVLKPEILILDEPTAGMDYQGKVALIKCLKQYHEKHQKSIIIISHVLEEITQICNKVLVMDSGKATYFGDTDKLLQKDLKDLQYMGLNSLQITDIMSLVRNKGFSISENISSVGQAKKELLRLLPFKGGDRI